MATRTTPMTPIVRNPIRQFIYGTAWLVIALSVGFVLINAMSGGSSLSDMQGQRTAGFIVLTPFIALAVSIFCFVRGCLAIAPYRSYLQKTPVAQRRKLQKNAWKNQGPPTALMAFVTVLAYAAFFVLLLVLAMNYGSISSSVNGIGTFTAILLLAGLLAAFFTELLVKIVRSRA